MYCSRLVSINKDLLTYLLTITVISSAGSGFAFHIKLVEMLSVCVCLDFNECHKS